LDENPRLPGDIAADEHRVFAPLLEYRRPLAVTRQDEEIAQVDVHGVDPATGRFEDPDLGLAGPGPGVDAVLVEELSVDLPRSIGAVELEPALDPDLRKQLRGTLGHRQKDPGHPRSEEHTSELQSRSDLVCRLLLDKKHHNKPT